MLIKELLFVLQFIVLHITEIFQEQHCKRVVFVNARVDAVSKGLAKSPVWMFVISLFNVFKFISL
jgi:hypothetical protein